MRTREGGIAMIGMVVLLGSVGALVMAVSSQVSGTRRALERVVTGRRLSGQAESAIAEALAVLAKELEGRGGIQTMSSHEWEPHRTRELVARDYPGYRVAPVQIRVSGYSAAENLGEVELVATVTTSRTYGSGRVGRTVVRRHLVSIGPDRRSIEISEAPVRWSVERSS